MITPLLPRKITLLGISRTGISTSKYLIKQGYQCFLSDTKELSSFNPKVLDELTTLGIEFECGGHSKRAYDCGLCIVSPGIPYTAEVIQKFNALNIETISDIELCYRLVDKPFICITGANGKSTITSLVSKILSDYGYKAPPIGNIGDPIFNSMEKDLDYYVVEISSFQLHYSPTLKPLIAIYTNYSPDHIDWHGSEEHYRLTKASLFTRLDSTSWAILNQNDPTLFSLAKNVKANIFWFHAGTPTLNSTYLEGNTIVYNNCDTSRAIMQTNDMYLIGQHNYENVMAAAAVGLILKIPVANIAESIRTFKPVEHRLELVETQDAIKFYNDSKATNPESAICALKALKGKDIVLIAGGKDKMTPLADFIKTIQENVRSVILIGQATARFKMSLQEAGFNNIETAQSLEGAVQKSYRIAKEVILFSPGCASFDMFDNFEERGRYFKQYVRNLYQ